MIINGKKYKPRELDFNAMCELEAHGVSITEIQGKSMSFLRAYAAMSMGVSAEAAGEEIEEHIISGGTLDTIGESFSDEAEKSGFFQAMQARGKAETKEEAESDSQTE